MNTLCLNIGEYQLNLLVNNDGSEDYVALKPLCEVLGIDWKSQHRRTQNNPQFRCGHMTIPSAGGIQEMLCIPVRQVGMWLCTINAKRVNEETKPKLVSFQENLQVVIHEHLTGNLTTERMQALESVVRTLQDIVAKMAY